MADEVMKKMGSERKRLWPDQGNPTKIFWRESGTPEYPWSE
jgi:hypothetical protein